jgi:methyl-accepting chemotaxis protein
MRLWGNLKIRTKIVVSIIAISLTFTTLYVVISITSNRSLSMANLQEKGSSLAIITGETVKASVQYTINEEIEKVLKQLMESDSDVSVAAVVIQGPKGEYAATAQKFAKGYESVNLTQPLKDLAKHPPVKKGEAVIVSDNNLKFIASKIDVTANDTLQNGYILLALNDLHSTQELRSEMLLMIALGAGLLLLSTAWAFFIARAITKPLEAAVAVAHALANGDLDVTVEVASLDETGQLLAALKRVVDTVQVLIADFSLLSESAIAGRLTVRADVTKHRGDFQKSCKELMAPWMLSSVRLPWLPTT